MSGAAGGGAAGGRRRGCGRRRRGCAGGGGVAAAGGVGAVLVKVAVAVVVGGTAVGGAAVGQLGRRRTRAPTAGPRCRSGPWRRPSRRRRRPCSCCDGDADADADRHTRGDGDARRAAGKPADEEPDRACAAGSAARARAGPRERSGASIAGLREHSGASADRPARAEPARTPCRARGRAAAHAAPAPRRRRPRTPLAPGAPRAAVRISLPPQRRAPRSRAARELHTGTAAGRGRRRAAHQRARPPRRADATQPPRLRRRSGRAATSAAQARRRPRRAASGRDRGRRRADPGRAAHAEPAQTAAATPRATPPEPAPSPGGRDRKLLALIATSGGGGGLNGCPNTSYGRPRIASHHHRARRRRRARRAGRGLGADDHAGQCHPWHRRADTLVGTAGIDASSASPAMTRSPGWPVPTGSTAASGDDEVSGGDGNDVIRGGRGADTLDGGAGDDRIAGRAGSDTILGGDGNDGSGPRAAAAGPTRHAGPGDDVIHARDGSEDKIACGAGDDTVYADFKDDVALTASTCCASRLGAITTSVMAPDERASGVQLGHRRCALRGRGGQRERQRGAVVAGAQRVGRADRLLEADRERVADDRTIPRRTSRA